MFKIVPSLFGERLATKLKRLWAILSTQVVCLVQITSRSIRTLPRSTSVRLPHILQIKSLYLAYSCPDQDVLTLVCTLINGREICNTSQPIPSITLEYTPKPNLSRKMVQNLSGLKFVIRNKARYILLHKLYPLKVESTLSTNHLHAPRNIP